MKDSHAKATQKLFIVWVQYKDSPYDVEAEKVFTSEEAANDYVSRRIAELTAEGYTIDAEDDDATVRVWIDETDADLSSIGNAILLGIHNAGGCDAKDEYSKGWDAAIGEAISIVEKITGCSIDTALEMR